MIDFIKSKGADGVGIIMNHDMWYHQIQDSSKCKILDVYNEWLCCELFQTTWDQKV